MTEASGGIEVLMLDGSATFGADALSRHSWLRLPEGEVLSLVAGQGGAKVWMKTGHLPFAKPPQV